MGIDFWNNPIVVSAFRVKYRRGGVFNVTTIYLLVLIAGGALLARYGDPVRMGPWPRAYLLTILGLQFVVSAVVAGNATTTSLRAEVVSRTLDFQRIAALTPRQILLGKLLGEPALAYLLAIATVPLTAFCWTLGVAGVSLDVLVLMYVNLASTTFLFGTLGLLQRLETGSNQNSRGIGVAFGSAIILGLVFVPPAFGIARQILAYPWSTAAVGLFTPVPAFYGIYIGDPWVSNLSFFGLQIPMLLVTPVSQLALGFLCLHTTSRWLVNPLNPSLSKRLAYVTLLAVDIMTAAVLLEPTPFGLAIAPRVTAFCLVHLLAGLLLMNSVTPWRESLESWVWRFRDRKPRLWDWWLGERSENGLVLVTFCVLGILGLVLLVLVPAGMQEGFPELRRSRPLIITVAISSTLLMLTLGTLHQWFVFVAGRAGKAGLVTFLAIIVLPLHLFGEYYHNEYVLALSPSAHFAYWFSGRILPHPEYMLAVYGGLLLWSGVSIRRGVGRLEKVIDSKLQTMGVVKPAPEYVG
jgi:hypothetical protein